MTARPVCFNSVGHLRPRLLRRIAHCVELGGPTLLVAFCLGCAAHLQAQSLSPQAKQSAPPDAIIEVWDQHWTLNEDGSTIYYEKKHVQLNSDRAYDAFADPRIAYNAETDKLEIISARVKRPDGTYRELPGYSHVKVSPDASHGWPAFAAIRQHLLVMSGIEPGCVVELEYKVTSEPGARPDLAADVRLDHHYPIQARTIVIETPPGAFPVPVLRLNDLDDDCQVETGVSVDLRLGGPGNTARRWRFEDLPAAPDEPQSPPWHARCPRLAFSTGREGDEWLNSRLAQIEAAADESETIAALATEWTKGQTDASDKLRALQKKLAGSFNFVNFDVAWRPPQPRPASEVIEVNYGLPEEAAALLLALARAVDLPVRPDVLVADHVWCAEAPQDGMVAVYVVLLEAGDGMEVWEAHRGRIVRDGHWAGHALLRSGTKLPPWTSADESRCDVRGRVTLKGDGTFTGELSLRTMGLFVSPESLRTTGDQKNHVSALVGRVLPDAELESFDVKALSADEFAVETKIKSSKPLKKLKTGGSNPGRYILQLAEDGPFLADVPIPLNHSKRISPVKLTGQFDEQIELTIEWPEKWKVEAAPSGLARVGGDWGEVEQTVAADGHSLTLRRHTRITQSALSPQDYGTLRGPLNELRSEHARTLLLKP